MSLIIILIHNLRRYLEHFRRSSRNPILRILLNVKYNDVFLEIKFAVCRKKKENQGDLALSPRNKIVTNYEPIESFSGCCKRSIILRATFLVPHKLRHQKTRNSFDLKEIVPLVLGELANAGESNGHAKIIWGSGFWCDFFFFHRDKQNKRDARNAV